MRKVYCDYVCKIQCFKINIDQFVCNLLNTTKNFLFSLLCGNMKESLQTVVPYIENIYASCDFDISVKQIWFIPK